MNGEIPSQFTNHPTHFGNFHSTASYGVPFEHIALFTGHAKLPSGIALYEFLKVVSCALLVDTRTGTVLDATFTTISPMTGSYISSIVVGWSFDDGISVLEKKFDKHVHISSRKAFLKSIEVARQRYVDFTSNSTAFVDRP